MHSRRIIRKKVVSYMLIGVLFLMPMHTKLADAMQIDVAINEKGENMASLKITSTAFVHNEAIPKKYTCDGEDVSPLLRWEGVPQNTKSFVLICDDPDAPMKTWVHWIVFNIPAHVSEFSEKVDPKALGAIEGQNSWGVQKYGYGGPCPPHGHGTHHYHFKFYALDIDKLNLDKNAAKHDVENAMKGHILAQGEIVGTYSR